MAQREHEALKSDKHVSLDLGALLTVDDGHLAGAVHDIVERADPSAVLLADAHESAVAAAAVGWSVERQVGDQMRASRLAFAVLRCMSPPCE